MEYNQKIDKYLDGELSGLERQEFEAELMRSPELLKEVEKFREIQALAEMSLESQQVDADIMETILRFKKGDLPDPDADEFELKLKAAKRDIQAGSAHRRTVLKLKPLWYAAAGILLLLASALLILKPFSLPSPDELYSEYLGSFKQNIAITELTRTNDDFFFAIQVFEAGDYERAAILFEMLEDSAGLQDYAVFYKGISYMKSYRTEEASSALLQLMKKSSGVLHMEAEWYLALCYLKLGKEDEARALLKIISVKNSDFSSQARKIIRSIR